MKNPSMPKATAELTQIAMLKFRLLKSESGIKGSAWNRSNTTNTANKQVGVHHPEDLVERGIEARDHRRGGDVHNRGAHQDNEDPQAQEPQDEPFVLYLHRPCHRLIPPFTIALDF